ACGSTSLAPPGSVGSRLGNSQPDRSGLWALGTGSPGSRLPAGVSVGPTSPAPPGAGRLSSGAQAVDLLCVPVRPGECPAVAQRFLVSCRRMCRSDRDCPATRKCCSNGCGQLCMAPVLGKVLASPCIHC
uniref:WAP domain-containing protein n=1 Tax=Gopherus agassizii TaxID=38772 RepID=A0A452HLR1_9SAUR